MSGTGGILVIGSAGIVLVLELLGRPLEWYWALFVIGCQLAGWVRVITED